MTLRGEICSKYLMRRELSEGRFFARFLTVASPVAVVLAMMPIVDRQP